MGIEVYPQTLKESLQSLNSNLESSLQKFKPLRTSIQEFVESEDLQSVAFNSRKDYMSRGHFPAIDNLTKFFEQFAYTNTKHIGYIDDYLGGEAYLSEERLSYQIDQLNALITTAETLELNTIADTLQRRLYKLQNKLEKLLNFASVTAGIYDSVYVALARVNDCLDTLDATIYNSATGEFLLPLANTGMGDMSKEDFVKLMTEQYGFDQQTAEIMYDMYGALQIAYPNISQEELDWRFTRLLGGLEYDDKPSSKWRWNQTAGVAIDRGMTEEEYFTQVLGMSLADYRLLRYKVRVQYEISGLAGASWSYNDLEPKEQKDFKQHMEKALGRKLTDKEFERLWDEQYNAMKGKGDFAHQQVTTAAILATDLRKSGGVANTYFLGNDERRENMAGWLGDATIGTPPILGTDDYIADLDAENITEMMKSKKISYWEASSIYYAEVGIKYTRAEKFFIC